VAVTCCTQPDFCPNEANTPGNSQRRLRGRRLLLVGIYIASIIIIFASSVLFVDQFAVVGIPVVLWLLTYGVFFVSTGLHDLCQPIPPQRLLVPTMMITLLLVAPLFIMGTVFVNGIGVVDWRLPAYCRTFTSLETSLEIAATGTWFIGTVVLYALALRWRRIDVLKRFAVLLVLASVTALEMDLIAHRFIEPYPDYVYYYEYTLFVAGTIAGLLWSLGPATVLLFLRPVYVAEHTIEPVYCTECGHDLRGSIVAGRKTCPVCRSAMPDVSA
jgi:hypothetical protein